MRAKAAEHPGSRLAGQMIRDVQNGVAQFSCILVYDVSRWGRFQDADESAITNTSAARRRLGPLLRGAIRDDGSPCHHRQGVKRAMAGEYSRELSSKVFQGACRLIQLGYKQAGRPVWIAADAH